MIQLKYENEKVYDVARNIQIYSTMEMTSSNYASSADFTDFFLSLKLKSNTIIAFPQDILDCFHRTIFLCGSIISAYVNIIVQNIQRINQINLSNYMEMMMNRTIKLDENTKKEIKILFDKVDIELSKPDNAVDMNYVNSLFSAIRKLDGNSFELTEEEIKRDLQKIYQKAALIS